MVRTTQKPRNRSPGSLIALASLELRRIAKALALLKDVRTEEIKLMRGRHLRRILAQPLRACAAVNLVSLDQPFLCIRCRDETAKEWEAYGGKTSANGAKKDSCLCR